MQLWLHYMGLSKLGTRPVVIIFDVHVPPCVQGLWVMTPHHSDVQPGWSKRLRSYVLSQSWMWFIPGLVNFCHGLSRAMKCHFYAVIFTRLQLCRLCWNQISISDCAVTCSNETGDDSRVIGLIHAWSHPPLKLTSARQSLVPNLPYAHPAVK